MLDLYGLKVFPLKVICSLMMAARRNVLHLP